MVVSFLVLLIITSCFTLSYAKTTSDTYLRPYKGSKLTKRLANGTTLDILPEAMELQTIRHVIFHDEKLFWSNGYALYQYDFTNTRQLIAGVITVVLEGANFGASSDFISLTVQGKKCTTIFLHTSTSIKCLITLVDTQLSVLKPSDVAVETSVGMMKGVAASYDTMVSDGYQHPIIRTITFNKSTFTPHAITIATDPNKKTWLYWSDISREAIYRSDLVGDYVEKLVSKVEHVYGLTEAANILYFTSGAEGTISSFDLAQLNIAPKVLVKNLNFPRGLVVDEKKKLIYFCQQKGQILKAALDGSNLNEQMNNLPVVYSQSLITLSTFSRLDEIAFDPTSNFLYWSEATTNLIARASVDTLEKQIVVESSADFTVNWPRAVALDPPNNKLYYGEWTGKIFQGAMDQLSTSFTQLIDQTTTPSHHYIDVTLAASLMPSSTTNAAVVAID